MHWIFIQKLQKLLIKNCSSGNSRPLLELSFSEGILKKINKIWGRANVQTTAGNLPYYHTLIWLEPESYDPEVLIQCWEKHIFQKFSYFFQSDNNTYDEMMSVYDNCVRIHTNSCEESHTVA